jgi:hypothetical protein
MCACVRDGSATQKEDVALVAERDPSTAERSDPVPSQLDKTLFDAVYANMQVRYLRQQHTTVCR